MIKKECGCCCKPMTIGKFDSRWVVDWYKKYSSDGLSDHCESILSGCTTLLCSSCGYRFFELEQEVTEKYYDGVTSQVTNYYPPMRAEWGRTAEFIQSLGSQTCVDVGCGAGGFFRALPKNVNKIGVDYSDWRKDESDFEFFRADLNKSFILPTSKVYTAFHVLEHIESPKRFLDSFYNSAISGSTMFFSVPNSGNYRNTESNPDPLNHPPHHLSQFTIDSVNALFSGYNEAFEVVPIEGISLPRIIARQYSQGSASQVLTDLFQTISSYYCNSIFKYESLYIRVKVE